MMATHELVVPRSMPIILLIESLARSLLADATVKPSSEAPRSCNVPGSIRSRPGSAARGLLARRPGDASRYGEISRARKGESPQSHQGHESIVTRRQLLRRDAAFDPARTAPRSVSAMVRIMALTLRRRPGQGRRSHEQDAGGAPWSLSPAPKATGPAICDLTRRSIALALAGGYAVAAFSADAEPIHTDETGLVTATVEIHDRRPQDPRLPGPARRRRANTRWCSSIPRSSASTSG